MDEQRFANEVTALKNGIPEDTAGEDAVRIAAERLSLHHYSALLGAWEADLPNMSRQDMMLEIDTVSRAAPVEIGLSEDADTEETLSRRIEIIRLLANQYALIQRLRLDDTEAWDTVYDLYFDD